MKTNLLLICVLALLLTAGCSNNGVTKRIQEKADVFARLTPRQQDQVQHGGIEPGYTVDMVYIALGQPTAINTSADGRDTVWIYKNYYLPDAVPQARLLMTGVVGTGTNRNQVSREYTNIYKSADDPRGPSMASTDPVGPMPATEVPDIPSHTLILTFRRNRIVDMRLDP